MAIEKRYREMLDQNIDEIRRVLVRKIEEKIVDNVDSLYKENWIQKYKEAISKAKSALEKAEQDFKKALPIIDDNDIEEDIIDLKNICSYRSTCWSYRDLTSLECEAIKSVIGNSLCHSLKNFDSFSKQTKRVFELSATNKEARNILLQFQSKNWNAMWVDLPILNVMDDFQVSEQGEVITKALPKGK